MVIRRELSSNSTVERLLGDLRRWFSRVLATIRLLRRALEPDSLSLRDIAMVRAFDGVIAKKELARRNKSAYNSERNTTNREHTMTKIEIIAANLGVETEGKTLEEISAEIEEMLGVDIEEIAV